jgi:hypothetical protein
LLRGKKWRKKRAKGPNALWIPATRKRRYVSLRSYLRGVEHLQLLRWRFKEKRQHGRRTHAKQQKLLPFLPHLLITNFSTKTILPSSPAARGGLAVGDALSNYMSFTLTHFEERHGEGGPGGNVRADFLSYFLCSATKKVHKELNSERVRSTG